MTAKYQGGLLAAVALLAGCAEVGPNYHRPEAATIPPAYAGATGEWKVARPQERAPRGDF